MPRTVDYDKRSQIAAKAFEVLRERGLRRTSMTDLAAALGMKRPTLYFYFRDPGEVFEAVFEETLARASAFVADRVASAGHPIDALVAYVRAVRDFHTGHEHFLVSMFQLWAGGAPGKPERVIARSREYIDAWRAVAIARLEAGVRERIVAPCDAAALVDLTRAIADGMVAQAVTGGREAAAQVDLLARLLAPLKLRKGGKRS